MKYAVVKVVNGNFEVSSEHGEDKQGAIVAFLNLSASLWNAPDAITASVRLVDENLDTVEGRMDFISHPVV